MVNNVNKLPSPFEDINTHYYKNAVIPPPEAPGEIIKYTRIAVDSKDRNTILHPEPNRYEIKLSNEVTDVMTARLISADIPLSMYMVNKYFDKLYVVYDGTPYTVALDHGDYTETAFATMVTTRLNAIIGSNTFTVSYNTATDNFTFAAAAVFSLDFGSSSNSLGAMLGFAKEQYTSNATGSSPYPNIIRSVYRKNFKYNNYIIMYIDQFDTYQSPSTQLERSFAIVPAIYTQLSISDKPELKKFFSPPIPRLTRLIVKFLDRYGNPYDFQNTEHRFEILLESNKQARKYNSIFGN
jgi:hypothetical protein